MNRPSRAFLLTLSLSALVSGCVSQYHFGYHHLGEGRLANSLVAKRSVKGLEAFEERCIRAFAAHRIEELRPLFAPALFQAIGDPSLRELDGLLRDRYGFTGPYERHKLVKAKLVIDEDSGNDAFKDYDLVGSVFILRGATDAVVRLFMVKINDEVRLAGFDVMDYRENPSGNNPRVRQVHPESTNKAGILRRPIP